MSDSNVQADTLDAVTADIRKRLDAIPDDIGRAVDARLGDKVSDEQIKAQVVETLPGIVSQSITELMESDPEFARGLKFGQEEPDRKIVGTKYARWGLTEADVEFLWDMQRALTGQRRVDGSGMYEGPSEELSQTFSAMSEAHWLDEDAVRAMDRKAIDDLFPRIPLSLFQGADRAYAAKGDFELTHAYQRAMDTAESGFGSQLIGAQYVRELWEAPKKLGRVFPLINTFEMTDPTSYLPVEAALPEMLFVAESTANNSTNYATVKTGSNRVQVDAKKFVIHEMWSGEMEEDSIIPFLPFLRAQAANSIAHYSDSLVLNGDTTNAATGNINLDDADPADTKHYLAFDGLRHAALVDNTANGVDHSGAAPTLAALYGLRTKMVDRTYSHDWGHPIDPMDLVYLCSPEDADKISASVTELVTVDKYGANATVVNGEVARIGVNPLVPTIAMSLTEADGKVSTTGGNNTLGQIVAFNRRGHVAGWRRRVRVETERLPATDQTRIVYSMRMGFGRYSPTGAAAGIESVAALYNVLV